MDQELVERARTLLDLCRTKGLTIAAAESCTGGLLAATLTEIAGSSDVFERGFVTYSNDAKSQILGVATALLDIRGAVSEPVARAMAEGALKHSPADVSVAVTGIAGPGGGSAEKPVGLVYIATARRSGETRTQEFRFGDLGRDRVRLAAVAEALNLIYAVL